MAKVYDEIKKSVENGYSGWLSEVAVSDNAIALAGSANYLVGAAVRCLIVGRDKGAQQLVERARSWLDGALERGRRGEPLGGAQIEGVAYNDLALCRWLSNTSHAPPDLSGGCAVLRAYLAGFSKRAVRKEWEWVFPYLAGLGDVEYCVREFEAFHPGSRGPRSAAAARRGSPTSLPSSNSNRSFRQPKWRPWPTSSFARMFGGSSAADRTIAARCGSSCWPPHCPASATGSYFVGRSSSASRSPTAAGTRHGGTRPANHIDP